MPRLSNRSIIVNRIQELRLLLGETQQQLADALGVTRLTVVSLEKGSYNPSLELAFRVAKHFNLRIDEVFFEHEA